MDTEDEAKAKWCPHARCLGDQASNRPAYGDSDPLCDEYVAEVAAWSPCIGSACMAWRWGVSLWKQEAKPGRKVSGFPNDGAGPVVGRHGEMRFATAANPVTKPVEIKRGYCGLSGRPE